MPTVREVSEEFYNTWRIMSIFNRMTTEPNGAYSTQLRAMLVLYNQRSCTQKKLAKTVGVKASGCSTLVNHLVEQGLAERIVNPEDRREIILRLTPKGEEACRGEMSRRYQELDQKFAGLSPQDREELVAAFQVLQRIQMKIPLEIDR